MHCHAVSVTGMKTARGTEPLIILNDADYTIMHDGLTLFQPCSTAPFSSDKRLNGEKPSQRLSRFKATIARYLAQLSTKLNRARKLVRFEILGELNALIAEQRHNSVTSCIQKQKSVQLFITLFSIFQT